MRKLSSLLVLSAALCFSALAGDTTRLNIKVTNLEGKPIDRASVVVNFVKGRNYIKLGKKMLTHWETRTNQEGMVKLPLMPQGTVTVMVIAKGYQTHGKNYDLNEDEQTIDIKLNPPQPQYSAHQ
jgi:hypothetical protein